MGYYLTLNLVYEFEILGLEDIIQKKPNQTQGSEYYFTL